VEKEQRLSALHDDVVDVHGDEVDADAVVNAGFDGELELGADAVGGGDQHRVLEAARLEIEQTAEATDATKQTFAVGLRRQGPDRLDQRVACVDIDARIAIGQSRFGLGGGGHRTTRGGKSGDLGITIVPGAARQGAKGRGSATFGGFTQRRGFGTLVTGLFAVILPMALFRLKRWSRIAGVALPLLAMPALAGGVRAADSLYEVAKISVDVTAKDAVAARDQGMAEAQMRAVKTVLQRLLPLSAQDQIPEFTPEDVEGLVNGVSIRSEQNSTTRYIATLDVSVNEPAIKKLLQD